MAGADALHRAPLAVWLALWAAWVTAAAVRAVPASAPAAEADFVRIPPGTFTMGSPESEPGHFDDETLHRVTLTRGFELCRHPVTQAEWQALMGWNDSKFAGRPDCPVESVTWFDAVAYCNERSRREARTPAYVLTDTACTGRHLTGADVRWDRAADGYRLPTDAEFEYACRAGTTTAFPSGPVTVPDPRGCSRERNLDAIAWYCSNSGGHTHPVMTKAPNGWGLFDMSGNVQQWCWDWFRVPGDTAVADPTGPLGGSVRVWRGGGWNYDPRHCRAADRGRDGPDEYFPEIGLRVARGVR